MGAYPHTPAWGSAPNPARGPLTLPRFALMARRFQKYRQILATPVRRAASATAAATAGPTRLSNALGMM